MGKWSWLILALVAVSSIHPAAAHEGRPLYLSITEQAGHPTIARMHVPPTVTANNRPILKLPVDCRADQPTGSLLDPVTWSGPVRFRCEGGLGGKILEIRYQLANPAVTTLFRLVREDGSELVHVLPPDQSRWVVPAEPNALQVARDYLRLGVEHIWSGLDHLLFVAGLVLLAGSWRRILFTITGFTIAHSITLALSALDLVRLAVPPTEAVIALSIVFLARELADPRRDTLAKRFPLAVACSFGLLHGFGFAAVLGDIGLPQSQIAIGLLFFNLGVEIGQIAFVALLLALIALVKWLYGWLPTQGHIIPFLADRSQAVCAYGLGMVASFWFIERLTGMF